jgi:hypothetical protein
MRWIAARSITNGFGVLAARAVAMRAIVAIVATARRHRLANGRAGNGGDGDEERDGEADGSDDLHARYRHEPVRA